MSVTLNVLNNSDLIVIKIVSFANFSVNYVIAITCSASSALRDIFRMRIYYVQIAWKIVLKNMLNQKKEFVKNFVMSNQKKGIVNLLIKKLFNNLIRRILL